MNRRRIAATWVEILGFFPLCRVSSASRVDPIPHPKGHRGWNHVKTLADRSSEPVFSSGEGILHIHANDRARTHDIRLISLRQKL